MLQSHNPYNLESRTKVSTIFTAILFTIFVIMSILEKYPGLITPTKAIGVLIILLIIYLLLRPYLAITRLSASLQNGFHPSISNQIPIVDAQSILQIGKFIKILFTANSDDQIEYYIIQVGETQMGSISPTFMMLRKKISKHYPFVQIRPDDDSNFLTLNIHEGNFTTESNEFNRRYKIFSTDDKDHFHILNPATIQALLDASFPVTVEISSDVITMLLPQKQGENHRFDQCSDLLRQIIDTLE